MREKKYDKMKRLGILLFFLISSISVLYSQSVGDYRSNASGNWTTLATWQRWNGTTWQIPTAAQGYPTSTSGVITIRSPHTVTVNQNNLSIDQTVINAGATLNFATTIPLIYLNVDDGPGIDLINNGTIIVTDASSSDSRLVVNGQMVNNNNIEVQVDCHIHVYGTLVNNDTIVANYSGGGTVYTGKVYVFGGGTFVSAPNAVVRGGGDFYLTAGATLNVGSSLGVNALGNNTGCIQTTYARYFSEEANYIYSGNTNQVTGTALSRAASVTITNTQGIVTFSDTLSMNYLIIEANAKANLNTFTHTAGALVLPEGSYGTGTWGSTASSASNKTNVYFDSTATGIVLLTNEVSDIFSITSTFSTCPTDSPFVAVIETWGAGGRGSTVTSNIAGGGGGGGAYSRDTITINPAITYTISVGVGSSGTSPGGDSWFGPTPNIASALVLAKGGNSAANNSTAGGTGGAASGGIGAVKYSGGRGANGSGTNAGGGGSSAGINANGNTPDTVGSIDGIPNRSRGAIAPVGGGNGGNAKFVNTGPGTPGTTPGGGGGGSLKTGSGTVAGGNGANGKVRILHPPIIPSITLGANPSVCLGTTSAILRYSATTGCPNLYRINYDSAANNAGFVDVAFTTLPADSIPIVIPSSVPAGIYHAYLIIKKDVDGFPSSSLITIKVNDPSFTSQAHEVSCYGDSDGSISITITSMDNGPYTFSINNGTTYGASFTGSYPNFEIINLNANIYKIRIKDQSGCVTPSCP